MAQLILDLGHRPALGREDFLVAPANQTAVAWIDRWPDWPGPVLALSGPPGCGKSHLLQVWRAMSGAREIDPAKTVLRDCVARAKSDSRISPVALARLKAMLDFVETVDRWYGQMLRLPKSTVMTLMKMGGKVANLVGRRNPDNEG